MFTKTLYNPAAVGSEEKICLDAAYNQWMESMPGAPTIANFNIHSPFQLFGKSHGVGISFANDVIGWENNIVARLNYAYRFNMGAGKLGIGVYGGIMNNTINPDLKTPFSAGSLDNVMPAGEDNGITPDFGTGVYYSVQNTYLSISLTHLTQPSLNYKTGDGDALFLKRTLYVSSGYELGMRNPLFSFRPSVFFKSDFATTQVAVSGIVSYNDRVWGGISYRDGNTVGALFGVELYDGIQFGLSYDYSLGDFQSLSGSTVEVLVKYCFSLKKEKIPQKYKSVRFL